MSNDQTHGKELGARTHGIREMEQEEYNHMDHGPSTDWGEDRASSYKTRLGLWMFLVYCIVYAGFVVINSVWPKLMERVIGGVNWAVAYGFGLIGFALILALVYNTLSSRAEEKYNTQFTDDEKEEF